MGNGGTGALNVTNYSTFNACEMVVGQNADGGAMVGSGTVHITDSTVNVKTSTDWSWYGWEGTLDIGRWGGTGTVNVGGYSTLNVVGRTNIGNNNNAGGGPLSDGSLTLKGYATMNTSPGTMRNYGWLWTDGGDVYVGCNEYWNGR